MLIRTESDYEKALARLHELIELNVPDSSLEFTEMESLSVLINHFESKKLSFPNLPLPELIKYHLLNRGMKLSEFSTIVGHRSIASEILSGKRKLSLNLIRKIHFALGIPYEILFENDFHSMAA